jgi:hypothetical protein
MADVATTDGSHAADRYELLEAHRVELTGYC